uniref:Tropomyosin n=1 Tax=Ascaris suum TaxID=6253 RepID=F1KVZ5_ASCSU
MDAIKKKMQAMKIEKDNALDRADAAEEKVRQMTDKLERIEEELRDTQNERIEEELRDTQKKMMQTENDLDKAQEDLSVANSNLEEKEKKVQEAEAEVAALNRRMTLLEEELERAEERLKLATEKLEEATHTADESERVRKVMENRSFQDEERANTVESQLKEAQMLAEEADRKYDEVARKLAMVEADLERAEERAEAGEKAAREMERELVAVGINLKTLEVHEERALQRENSFSDHVHCLQSRIKEAETRAEFAERSVQKLQKEVDRLEEILNNGMDAANAKKKKNERQQCIFIIIQRIACVIITNGTTNYNDIECGAFQKTKRDANITIRSRRSSDELVHEKERYKSISEELDQTFQELSGY